MSVIAVVETLSVFGKFYEYLKVVVKRLPSRFKLREVSQTKIINKLSPRITWLFSISL